MEYPEQTPSKRIISLEERAFVDRALGAFGLYDASQDYYPLSEYPDDDQWVVRSGN